jgi:actin
MEKIWHHIFYNELRVVPEEHPVLASETPLSPMSNREKMTQMIFESFNVPAYNTAFGGILGVYASGRCSAMCIDSGDGVTHLVPVYEGYTFRSAITRVEFGGSDITADLLGLLNQRGHGLSTTTDTETVRDIKEKHAYVAEGSESSALKQYTMPDGRVITLGDELANCTDRLFSSTTHPSIPDIIRTSIQKCDVDTRRDFQCNIVVSGGNTFFPGFAARLHKELLNSLPCFSRVRIVAPEERKFSVWIGGSILASLSTYQSMWITKQEYEESGPSIVHRKGM